MAPSCSTTYCNSSDIRQAHILRQTATVWPMQYWDVVLRHILSDVTKQPTFGDIIDIALIYGRLWEYCWNWIQLFCIMALRGKQILKILDFWSSYLKDSCSWTLDEHSWAVRKHNTFSWTDDLDNEIKKRSNKQTNEHCSWTDHKQIFEQQTL